MINDISLEVRQQIKDDGMRPATKLAYAFDLNIFKSWLTQNEIQEVKLSHIKKFFEDKIKIKKYSTVKRYRSCLVREYPELKKWEPRDILDDLFKGFRQNYSTAITHSIPVTVDLYLKLIDEVDKIVHKIIFMLQFKSGCRINEILSLEVDDIEFLDEGLQLRIKKSKHTRNERYVGLKKSAAVGIFLTAHIERYHLMEKDKIFKIKRGVILHLIKRILGEEYGTHSLRSGHIISALKAGYSPQEVMRTTGHRNATVFYIHYCQMVSRFDNSSDIV